MERLTLENLKVARSSATFVILGGIYHVPPSLFRRRRLSRGSATLAESKRNLRLPPLHLKSLLMVCVKFGKVHLLRQFLQRMSTLLPEFLLYADRPPPDLTTLPVHQRE